MKMLVTLVFLLLTTGALAQEIATNPQRQQQLAQRVEIESQSHQARIAILNRADRCIKAAKTAQDYKNCENMEKQERQANRETVKAQREAFRTQMQQQRPKRQASPTP